MYLGRLAPNESMKTHTMLSQESLQKAIAKFKAEFCDSPGSPLHGESIDKLVA